MTRTQTGFHLKRIPAIAITAFALTGSLTLPEAFSSKALANPSMVEFRWDDTGTYKKLYYTQSSRTKRDRSTYYLIMKKRDRKNATLKLSLTIPKYFDATITPKKLSLCKVMVGGMLERTKCKENIPAVFEVNNDNTSIEVFPDEPIPARESIALVMKIFNPSRAGMFQINVTSQTPGDLPISSYIGSWNIDID